MSTLVGLILVAWLFELMKWGIEEKVNGGE